MKKQTPKNLEIIKPLVEIPSDIFKNPKEITSVMNGLEDIKNGRVSELERDFSGYK